MISEPVENQIPAPSPLESERFANKVLKASLNGLYIYDVDQRRIIFINPQYTRLTGYLLKDLQEIPGDKFLDLFHPDEVSRIIAHIEAVKRAADGDIIEIEYRFKRADGRWIWAYSFESVFSRHKDGRVQQYIGTFIDITARKEAEAKIEMALAGANAGSWSWSMRTGLIKFSVELYHLLGLDPSLPAPDATTIFRSIYKDDRQWVRREFEAVLKSRLPSYALELRFTRPDGLVIWLSSTGRIEYDEQGRGLRAYGINQDITQRKQAEEKLRASEARFRDLADSMPQLVWTARPDGQVDYYNWRYREYDGITLAGRDNWEWSTVLHPDDYQSTMETWQQAVKTGEIFQVEHRMHMFDGSYRWHLSRGLPVLDHENRVVRWFGTSTDIHDMKMAEARLREQNQRLALLSDAAAELLRGADPHGLIDRAFQRLANMFGLDTYVQYMLSEDETHLELAAYSNTLDQTWEPMKQLALGQGVSGSVAASRQPMTIQDVQKDTDPRCELIRSLGLTAYTCYPLIVKGRMLGTLAFGSHSQRRLKPEAYEMLQTVCDLVATATDRARAEADLQRYAWQLERSNRDLQEFAFVASHDLQEPLRKIEAFGSILMETSNNLSEKQSDYLSRMRSAAGRMRTMVDDLLELSRVNRINRPFEAVDLKVTIQEVLSDLEMQVKRTAGVVKVGDLPVVEADPLQMRQLFQNLIGNGLKFHQPGVVPVVKVSSRAGQLNGRSVVQLVVEDEGIGFSEKEAERIFQPFQRLVGRKNYEGSGIGLALCRKIVERHGGEITASGLPDQGATFVVTLPAKVRATLSGASLHGYSGTRPDEAGSD